MEAEEETEKIAQHFEAIFGQNDVKPTIEEEAKLKSNLDTLESRVKTENKPSFYRKRIRSSNTESEHAICQRSGWHSKPTNKSCNGNTDLQKTDIKCDQQSISKIRSIPRRIKNCKNHSDIKTETWRIPTNQSIAQPCQNHRVYDSN